MRIERDKEKILNKKKKNKKKEKNFKDPRRKINKQINEFFR